MKTVSISILFCMISFGLSKTCSAQPPQWVTDLANEVFTLDIGQITHWEEKQMTWYNIDGLEDESDSVNVNTLYIEGITTSNQKFIGAIPVTGHEIYPLGSRAIKSQTCTGMCGCQCCKFRKDDYGCFCDTQGEGGNCCVVQSGCSCWCQHTLTSDR